tara:strand:- start:237 stop:596 length:360 start_codon:yes stop_codon:yes gene_type:complete
MLKKSIFAFLIVASVISLVVFLSRDKNSIEFNSEKWKSWTESEAELSTRWNMISSLREKHELKGKTKTEIIILLGKPQNKTNNEFYYYLGMSGFGINTGTLYLKFNEENKVVKINIWDG